LLQSYIIILCTWFSNETQATQNNRRRHGLASYKWIHASTNKDNHIPYNRMIPRLNYSHASCDQRETIVIPVVQPDFRRIRRRDWRRETLPSSLFRSSFLFLVFGRLDCWRLLLLMLFDLWWGWWLLYGGDEWCFGGEEERGVKPLYLLFSFLFFFVFFCFWVEIWCDCVSVMWV
jgi:hypothetical protein